MQKTESSQQTHFLYWPYIIISYLALLSFGVLDNVRGPYFPNVMSSLQLRDDEGAWFFALTSLVALGGSYLAPRIQNFIGALMGLRLGLFLLSLGFFLMGVSPHYQFLLFGCGIFGLGMGISQVFEHVCIQEGASPHQRRRLFSGLHSFYALASLFAPLSVGIFLSWNWDWRKGFVLFSFIPAIVFIVSLFVKKQKKSTVHIKVPKAKGRELGHMAYIALVQALYVSAEISIGTRLVLYIQRTTELTPSQSTYYLTAFFVFLLLGRLLTTYFDFKKLSNRGVLLIALALSALVYILGLSWTPIFFSLCGLTMAPIFAVSMDYLAETFKEKSTHAISLSFTIGALFIVSMHYLVGYVTEVSGIAVALTIGPALLITSWLLLFFEKPIFEAN